MILSECRKLSVKLENLKRITKRRTSWLHEIFQSERDKRTESFAYVIPEDELKIASLIGNINNSDNKKKFSKPTSTYAEWFRNFKDKKTIKTK